MKRLLVYYQSERLDVKFLLSEDRIYRLGRDSEMDLRVTWDDSVSRQHVTLECVAGGLKLAKATTASNPVFIAGQAIDKGLLSAGQSFVVGKTRFEFQNVTQTDSAQSATIQQLPVDRQKLKQLRYEDADKRIEVLTSLPAVIRESGVERDLYVRLTSLLLAGIQHADGIAVVEVSSDRKVKVLQQQRRYEVDGMMKVSSRLATTAAAQNKTILNVWDDQAEESSHFTQHAEFHWAFCTPLFVSSSNSTGDMFQAEDSAGEPEARTAIHDEGLSDAVDQTELSGSFRMFYVAGRSPTEGAKLNQQRLHADIKFTEFIAEIVNSLQRQRELERQQSGLRQFFSPPVLEALGHDLDTSMLEPRECDITVLFCDLRGFSHQAEEQADNLTGLLERVSMALEVMTSQILRFGGVTGDFQGDAALGFWGWPISSEQAALNACRAALAIHDEFANARADENHPLKDFETSIGVAHGRAVAGKIGTREQVKVTVFGPVVNLASRLEGMTRQLHVPILIDDNLDRMIRNAGSGFEGRLRQLLQVQPYGMDHSLIVSELVPPASKMPQLTDQHLQDFELGLKEFITGNWEDAYRYLHSMPADDRAQDFLAMKITQHGRSAPEDWDGMIRMEKKGG